jgi:hypothetical protein
MLIACPSCQRQLNVPENAAGKQVRCPATDCGTVFFVPAPQVPVAPPKRPAHAADAGPFDFNRPSPVGPEADFGFVDHTEGGIKGIGLRTRINRAAGWLNTAAGSIVFYTLFVITILIAFFVMTAGQRWQFLVGAACFPFVLLPFPVAMVIGARMLARTRRWGIALAGTIVSLVVGVLSLLGLVGAAISFLMSFVGGAAAAQMGASAVGSFAMIAACGNLVLLTVMAFFCTFAGIVGMRVLLHTEIKKTFA